MTFENLQKLQASIPETMDAILLSNEKHQYYMTGINIEDGYVAVMRNAAFVFVDFRYIEVVRNALAGSPFVIHMNTDLKFVRDTLAENGAKAIGFEDRYVTVSQFERYKGVFGEGYSPVAIGNLMEKLRTFKTEYELDMIKAAQEITDKAFEHILGFITPERTETEVALELETFMRRLGATGPSFSTISISGAATSLPHGEPKDRKLEPGFLTMDYGCVYKGYCSDMTRTVCVGKPTEEMKHVYATVLAAQRAVLETIDWHKDCGEMDAIAREIIDRAGYEGAFGHSLGHGVGLYIHEEPRLHKGYCGTLLENGHVVTVEPGIYLAGKFGVRIEDMVVIHGNRAEDITHSPKNLIVL